MSPPGAESTWRPLAVRLSGEEARRLRGEAVPMDAVASGTGMLSFTIPRPLGVMAAITPFNFPLNLVAHKVGPALAAGCPVVLKPSEKTPLTAGLLAEVLDDCGLPAGWLNLVTGDPSVVVGAWLAVEDGVLRPTVLTGVPETARLMCDEAFGPVVSVRPVSGADEAIESINASSFGLNAAVYTRDLGIALDFAQRVHAGTVLVNRGPSYRADHAPYGGVKKSGEGREGVHYAVQALLEPKLVILGAT